MVSEVHLNAHSFVARFEKYALVFILRRASLQVSSVSTSLSISTIFSHCAFSGTGKSAQLLLTVAAIEMLSFPFRGAQS
jgi:hypothetical protein